MLGAAQRASAFDANRRRPGARDPDAELREKRAQLDDVRLAGGVANLADAFAAAAASSAVSVPVTDASYR